MKTPSFLTIVTALLLLGGPYSADCKQKPIRIGYLQSDIHQLACWVALEKGLYRKNGVEVEVSGIFKAGPEEMSAFAAGALDVGYVGEAPATTAVANKAAEVTVLAQVNTEGSAIVVGKESPVKEASGLAGKRVAIPGHSTVQDFLLKKALIKFNVDQKSVNVMVLKPPEMIGALRTGQIDAFIAWEPYPAKALTMGVGIGWMTLVAAEFTGVKSGYGLGYMIMTARDIQRPDEILAGMLIIGLIGVLINSALRACESRIVRWQ